MAGYADAAAREEIAKLSSLQHRTQLGQLLIAGTAPNLIMARLDRAKTKARYPPLLHSNMRF